MIAASNSKIRMFKDHTLVNEVQTSDNVSFVDTVINDDILVVFGTYNGRLNYFTSQLAERKPLEEK